MLPGTLPPPCELGRASYVVDRITPPSSRAEADALAIDRDGDGYPENTLGQVHTLLVELGAADAFDDAVYDSLQSGSLLWLIHVDSCEVSGDSHVRISLDVGQDVDGDATNNLTGSGVLNAIGADGIPAVGTGSPDRPEAGMGRGVVPLSAFFDVVPFGPEDSWPQSLPFSVVSVADGTRLDLEIYLAIDADVVADVLLEPFRRTFQLIFDSTPGCPAACADDGVAFLAELIDGDLDGAITSEEVEVSAPFIMWTQPDLDLLSAADGEGTVYWPRHDRVKDSSSLGIRAHAVPVTIVP